MPLSISIIMPAFNEEANIERALKETIKTMNSLNANFEIIVVDDGSTDNTKTLAESVAKKNSSINVVGYFPNKGKGNAIKFASGFVSKQLVSFFDSDLDIPPSQIKIFLDALQESRADIVVGSKLHPGSKIVYPLLRKILSYCYHLFVKLLFNLDVRDTQVGLKLFRAAAIKKIMPLIAVKRFAFDLELLVVAKKLGYKIVEAPIEINYSNLGSTVSPLAIFGIFVDTCAVFYRKNILHYYDR